MPLSPLRKEELRLQNEEAREAIEKVLQLLRASGVAEISLAITLAGVAAAYTKALPPSQRIPVARATLLSFYNAARGDI
jgi:hypothetical protein